MPFATRIHQVRLEHLLSLEDLAVKAGLSPSLLASFENGQDVPALEVFDRLAGAMGVPIERFFYNKMDSNLTPWLTPRVTWQELVYPPPTANNSLLNLRRLLTATQGFLALVTMANRGLRGKILKSTVPPPNPRKREAVKGTENVSVSKREL